MEAILKTIREKLESMDEVSSVILVKESNKKNKRFYVELIDKAETYHKVHFGSKSGQMFLDHGDEKKRQAWIKRHSNIKLKDGSLAINKVFSPSFMSFNLLWN